MLWLLLDNVLNKPSESEALGQEFLTVSSSAANLGAILGTIIDLVCCYLVAYLIIEFVIWVISKYRKYEPPKYDAKEFNKRKALLVAENNQIDRKQSHKSETPEPNEVYEDDLL